MCNFWVACPAPPRRGNILLSGLLKCGVCGNNMPVLGGRPVYYGCKMYRQRGTCSNSVTIRLDVLEQALKGSLSAIFKDPTFRPFIVAEVIEEVHRLKAREKTLKASLAGQNETLLEERRRLAKMIDNLVSAIGEVGGSTAMKKKVVAAEARGEQIEALLKHPQEKISEPIGRDQVSAFVDEEVRRLVDMMFADRETAKNHLRKYIPEIVMMPFDKGRVRGYYVTGSVDLFLGSNNVM